jgi:hypothetical protein
MSVPIATSHGRSGYGPQLSLSYDSGAGNECFGWSLSLPAITRKTNKGLPTYQDPQESDVYVLSGSEDLVPILELENGAWVRDDSNPFTASRKRPAYKDLAPTLAAIEIPDRSFLGPGASKPDKSSPKYKRPAQLRAASVNKIQNNLFNPNPSGPSAAVT